MRVSRSSPVVIAGLVGLGAAIFAQGVRAQEALPRAPEALPSATPATDWFASSSAFPSSSVAPAIVGGPGVPPSASTPVGPVVADAPPVDTNRDALVEPVRGARQNFVPDLLRLPDFAANLDFSLLVRSSPRPVDGTIKRGLEKGFRFDEATVPMGPGGVLIGASVGFAIVMHDRWIFPTGGFDLVHSVGAGPRLLSGRGGNIVASETWTTTQLGVTLLGVGVRGKYRRWQGSVILEPGLLVQLTDVSAPSYEGESRSNASALGPRVLVTGTGCRRLDPTVRLCFSASPHVYALGFGNGFTLGFRTEVGP